MKLETVKLILLILEVIASLALVVVIMMQSSKESGLGAISGNSETYMGKGKAKSLDKKLASATKWIVLAWALFVLCRRSFTLQQQFSSLSAASMRSI